MSQRFGGGRRTLLAWSFAAVLVSFLAGASMDQNVFKPDLTFFVHCFSHATSPLFNVFRNCAYYWTFGAYIAYYVNHPHYTPVTGKLSPYEDWVLLSYNGILGALTGMEEIYQWLGFNTATQTVAGYVFLVVAALIMTNWALAKHRYLKRLFDGKEGRPSIPDDCRSD